MEPSMDDENIPALLGKLEKAKSAAGNWRSHTGPDFSRWFDELRAMLRLVGPEYERSLDSISFSPPAISPLVTNGAWEDAFKNGLDQAVGLIDRASAQLKNRDDTVEALGPKGRSDSRPKQIFIVHGRDSECKIAVAWFVERLKFKAVILHDQANAGQGIIEKLEENADDVVYAIILLTPDDLGRHKDEGTASLVPRARQNVIFEFGYFIGRLGRERVCVIMKDWVEIPSDLLGVVYIPFDQPGSWKLALARELKSLGLDIDLNLVI